MRSTDTEYGPGPKMQGTDAEYGYGVRTWPRIISPDTTLSCSPVARAAMLGLTVRLCVPVLVSP